MDPIKGDAEGVWNQVLARAEAMAREAIVDLSRIPKSPIEARFLAAFWLLEEEESIAKLALDPDGLPVASIWAPFSSTLIVIRSQAPVGDFRGDFGITREQGRSRVHCVVELDGHDFHEKTKEQVERDKTRSRFFVAAGVQVLRFSGSEIWRNAAACATEVSDLLRKQLAPLVEAERLATADRLRAKKAALRVAGK